MARIPVDFREVQNDACSKCSNKEARKKYAHLGLCDHVPSNLDGLPLRCVGPWGQEKVFCLLQYLGIFSQGMKNRWNGRLHYLEICSGPGRLIDFRTGSEFDGSALAVLRHECSKLLKSAFFVDINPKVVGALNTRIEALGAIGDLKPRAWQGDYNAPKDFRKILSARESGGLNLLFIDPTDLSFPFSTLEYLVAELGKADLIINIPVYHDFKRNAARAVFDEQFSRAKNKYENFLGSPGFLSSLQIQDRLKKSGDWVSELGKIFMEQYQQRLRELGYAYFGSRKIQHYYDLLFASMNPKGIEFWNKAQAIDFRGQRSFGF